MGEWKTVALPIPEPTSKIKGVRIPNGKCLLDGEPIIVKRKILPVDDSVQEHVTGKLKGGTIAVPNHTGDCPECFAHVPLSDRGFVTAHVVKGGTAEPTSMLTEPQVDPTDTGSRIGDPRSAMQRRTVELDGAYEHGTVEIPVKGKNGRTKLEEAPATEENVRAALAYWVARKIVKPDPGSSADKFDRWQGRCDAQSAHVSTLTRRLEAMRKGTAALTALESPEGLGSPTAVSPLTGKALTVSGTSPGPALVKGRSERPMAGPVTVRQPGEEYTRPADPEDNRRHGDTWTAPTGRERMDKESSTVPFHGGTYGYLTRAQYDDLSRSQQRKYWDRIRKQKAYAKAHRGTQVRVPVKLGTAGMGNSSFAEGDSRETERVMRQPKS